MRKEILVSQTIAEAFKELGFREYCECVKSTKTKFGGIHDFARFPTVDQAIDWLRRKFNVIIYNAIEPFVDPTVKKPRILYRYSVKWCNLRDGWNGRKYIGESKLIENPYVAKRQAIMIAIRYIKKKQKCSKKTK
jgi:hypothetical protein